MLFCSGADLMKILLLFILFTLPFVDNYQPRPMKLQGGDKVTLRTSITQMRNSLPLQQRQLFDHAVEQLMFEKIDFEEFRKLGEVESSRRLEQRICYQLSGKTAYQIIDEYQKSNL